MKTRTTNILENKQFGPKYLNGYFISCLTYCDLKIWNINFTH